jgi:hypothetical protein
MRKCLWLWLLFILPAAVYGQNQSFKGFYQARFFNVLGDIKVIEAEFEVQENNSIVGKVKIGDETKNLQGSVKSKGKFEAQTPATDGTALIIKGEFAFNGNDAKVSLIQRWQKKEKGSKQTSETTLSGFIKSMPPTVELKDVGISDNGKTQLWFQHTNPLFGKEWTDVPATVKLTNVAGQTSIAVEIKTKTSDSERGFSFRMWIRQKDQKVWLGRDLAMPSYREKKEKAAGGANMELNFFLGSNGNVKGGQVEIVSEDENKIVFKVTNLLIKRYIRDDFVQIDGFIHAMKIS